jgi:hypothetical protein
MRSGRLLDPAQHADILANFTIDSPVPFNIDAVHRGAVQDLNQQMVPGCAQ